MKNIGAVKKPTFFWQGVLILLPVLVLSVLGIYSLKLERQRAEQEATEQAQRFAEEFADAYEQQLTNSSGQETIVLELDSALNLLSPPPLPPVPEPHPLDLTQLSPEQTILWHNATSIPALQQFLDAKPSPDFAALALYKLGLAYRTKCHDELRQKTEAQAQASGSTIGDFLDPAIYVCPQAADAFAKVIDQYPDALTESGLPMLPLAQMHWLETADISSEERQKNLLLLGANSLSNPSLLTAQLLKHLELLISGPFDYVEASSSTPTASQPISPEKPRNATPELRLQRNLPTPLQNLTIQALKNAWDKQQQGRALYEKLRAYTSKNHGEWPRFFWLDQIIFGRESGMRSSSGIFYLNETWLAQPLRQETNGLRIVCINKSSLLSFPPVFSSERARLPKYAGLSLELAGQALGNAPVVPGLPSPTFATPSNETTVFQLVDAPVVNPPTMRAINGANPVVSSTNGTLNSTRRTGASLAWMAEPFKATPKTLASSHRMENGIEYLRVNVHLVDPAILYRQTRNRMLWIGLLIGTAALAAFIGWLAAWRAFQRQHQLAVMKTNFVSSVSHELRAPIASVRLLAEGLERGKIKEAPKQHEYFRLIVQECRRLSSLVENVLDFSRIEQGRKEYEFEFTDLKALVEQTVRLMEPAAEERQIRLERHLTNEPVTANVDGRALQQALVNLIDNALKHSPKDSAIQINLESAINNQLSTINLSVQDHGPGIPPEDHERIFERFYRRGSELRRETQGVGIGLSIVKHIVEAHGGRVSVESAVGKGSRFTISLPLKS